MSKMYALWFEPNLGLCGYICGLIKKGSEIVPVGVCSVENWSFGELDSLRKGWIVPDELTNMIKQEIPPKEWDDNLPAANLGFMKISPEEDLSGNFTSPWKRIKGDAYRIWPNGKYASWNWTYDGEFLPGYVPNAVKQAFSQVDWDEKLQGQDYPNLDERMKEAWGIAKRKRESYKKENLEAFTEPVLVGDKLIMESSYSLVEFDDKANIVSQNDNWFDLKEPKILTQLKKKNWFFIDRMDIDEKIFQVYKEIPTRAPFVSGRRFDGFGNDHALAVVGVGVGKVGHALAQSKCGNYYSRRELQDYQWLPRICQIIPIKE